MSKKVHMLAYDGDYSGAVVSHFANKTEATEAAALSEKQHRLVIGDDSDLQQFSMAELCKIYEAITTNVVAKFRDLKTGQLRILTVLAVQAKTEERDNNMGTDEGAENETKETEDMTSKTKTTKTKTTKTKTPKAPKAPKAPKSAKSEGSSRLNKEAKINIITKENPRRKGSQGWKSYELMTQGMKVSTYLEKGGRATDLRWDIAAGNVSLVD